MRNLYFDCSMGAAGDMLTAALLGLFPDKGTILQELNGLGLHGVEFLAETVVKCGVTGTHMRVVISGEEEDDHHHHHHSGLADIAHIVGHSNLSPALQKQVLAVYEIIAQAESQVHGVSVEQVHFHEVGAMDAIADISAVCYLMDKLGVDAVYASPVHVGSGQVKCAHGLLPVPAPATALILQGVPIYGGQIKGELCTPTGAALLKYYVNQFGEMPVLAVSAVGYGMGKKDFDAPNCVRAMLGSSPETADRVVEFACQMDDMTGEAMGFATEQLLAGGALDVYTTPIYMKKNRPGILLTVLCQPQDREKIRTLIFRHTTTLGVREYTVNRHTLSRRTETVATPYGPVQKKIAEGFGVSRTKYEYEDLARIARENDIPLSEIID